MTSEQEDRVRPNGQQVRRLRHEQGWSPRDLVAAIAEASERATGIRTSITPSLLSGVEEKWEIIPYETLCLIADGLDCDPVDILEPGAPGPPAPRTH
jgi:hypothetical protein